MDTERLRRRLGELTALDAPSGFEEPVLRRAAELFAPCTDRIEFDLRGNLYAWKQGRAGGGLTVMLGAHADEVGFVVTGVTPAGFLRVARVGFPTEQVLPGQRVRVLAGRGVVEGAIGVKPAHVLAGAEARTVPPVDRLYVDIGVSSPEAAAAAGVEVGTPVCFSGPLAATAAPERVLGKAIDNRAGVLALVETAERLADRRLDATVVFSVAVEEEVGLRGAAVAARHVSPDVFLAVDTVPVGGTPDLAGGELPGDIGLGPILKVAETRGLCTHRPLREFLRGVAAREGIAHQVLVDVAGITDATAAQQASGQIAAGVVAIPRRYAHSAAELLDLRDLEGTVRLLTAALPLLTGREQLRRL